MLSYGRNATDLRVERAEPTAAGLTLTLNNAEERHYPDFTLTAEDSAALFRRAGRIRQVLVELLPDQLFAH